MIEPVSVDTIPAMHNRPKDSFSTDKIRDIIHMTEEKQTRYQARQQRVKEQVDSRIEAAQEERGILVVITGNGKGKTTSGFGTVARATGHGLKCGVAQFIKGSWDNGERNLLEQHGVQFHVIVPGLPGKHKIKKPTRSPLRQSGNTAGKCCRTSL